MDKYDRIVQDYNNDDVDDILEVLGGNTQALFKINSFIYLFLSIVANFKLYFLRTS